VIWGAKLLAVHKHVWLLDMQGALYASSCRFFTSSLCCSHEYTHWFRLPDLPSNNTNAQKVYLTCCLAHAAAPPLCRARP
jgi:hypothetical protein